MLTGERQFLPLALSATVGTVPRPVFHLGTSHAHTGTVEPFYGTVTVVTGHHEAGGGLFADAIQRLVFIVASPVIGFRLGFGTALNLTFTVSLSAAIGLNDVTGGRGMLQRGKTVK